MKSASDMMNWTRSNISVGVSAPKTDEVVVRTIVEQAQPMSSQWAKRGDWLHNYYFFLLNKIYNRYNEEKDQYGFS